MKKLQAATTLAILFLGFITVLQLLEPITKDSRTFRQTYIQDYFPADADGDEVADTLLFLYGLNHSGTELSIMEAIDIATQELLFTGYFTFSEYSERKIVQDNDLIIVATSLWETKKTQIEAFDVKNGELRWEKQLDGMMNSAYKPRFWAHKGRLFFLLQLGTPKYHLLVYDSETGEILKSTVVHYSCADLVFSGKWTFCTNWQNLGFVLNLDNLELAYREYGVLQLEEHVITVHRESGDTVLTKWGSTPTAIGRKETSGYLEESQLFGFADGRLIEAFPLKSGEFLYNNNGWGEWLNWGISPRYLPIQTNNGIAVLDLVSGDYSNTHIANSWIAIRMHKIGGDFLIHFFSRHSSFLLVLDGKTGRFSQPVKILEGTHNTTQYLSLGNSDLETIAWIQGGHYPSWALDYKNLKLAFSTSSVISVADATEEAEAVGFSSLDLLTSPF